MDQPTVHVQTSSSHLPAGLQYEFVSCDLCGADDPAVRFHVDTQSRMLSSIWLDGIEHELRGTETVVTCRSCGLTYVNPRLADVPNLAPYSIEREMHYFDATRVSREKAYGELLAQVPIWLGHKPDSLLDIGFGDGVLLGLARRAGIEAVGFEVSDSLIELVRKRLGAEAVVTTELPQLQTQFDVVALINVIEHLRRPSEVMDQAYRLLKPGGIFLVFTPNLGGIPARLAQARWSHIEPFAHFYYFTAETLAALMRQAGFRPIGRFNLITASGIRAQVQRWLGRAGIHLDNGLGMVARRLPARRTIE